MKELAEEIEQEGILIAWGRSSDGLIWIVQK